MMLAFVYFNSAEHSLHYIIVRFLLSNSFFPFRLSTMQIDSLNLWEKEIDFKIGWTITGSSFRSTLIQGQLSRYVIFPMF